MVILDQWGISFHPVVVVGLGNDLLFNSILAHCVVLCLPGHSFSLHLILPLGFQDNFPPASKKWSEWQKGLLPPDSR